VSQSGNGLFRPAVGAAGVPLAPFHVTVVKHAKHAKHLTVKKTLRRAALLAQLRRVLRFEPMLMPRL
jgi:hypothetical protein